MTTEEGRNSGKLANKRVRGSNKLPSKKKALPLNIRAMLDSNPLTDGYDPLLSIAILANDPKIPQPARLDCHKFMATYMYSPRAAEDSKGNAPGVIKITIPEQLELKP